MHSVTNPFQEHARLAKAVALADRLTANEVEASYAQQFPPDAWKLLARAAGVNPPSEATIDLVLSLLRKREADTSDLFDLPRVVR